MTELDFARVELGVFRRPSFLPSRSTLSLLVIRTGVASKVSR